jgi:hypothetical protein
MVSIGAYAFAECWALESIIIPDDILEIPDGAFLNCSALASITISSSVSQIREYAFSGCSNSYVNGDEFRNLILPIESAHDGINGWSEGDGDIELGDFIFDWNYWNIQKK